MPVTDVMPSKRLPTAKEAMEKLARAEAKKASEAVHLKEKLEAQKKAAARSPVEAVRHRRRRGIRAGRSDHRAGNEQWFDRSGSSPIPQRFVHRSRPRHQQRAGARLGEHADWTAEGDVQFL